MNRPRDPIATYRVQLTPAFGFVAAARALDYIAGLGVSHLYLSPIFEARRGSMHGYDGTDPRAIRAELGGRKGFRELVRQARRRGLRILLDIVPNHLSTSPCGAPFRDVLRWGPRSRFASWFDVDWERPAPDGARAIVLPRLERPLDEAIARGEVAFDAATRELVHGADRFPWPTARLDRLPPHYRLVPWREGMVALNYSRYLDIADLIRVRVEDPQVFAETHALVRELIEREWIDGLRIDHLDGLLEPQRYLDRLRRLVPRARRRSFWIVVEATAGEDFERATTGYDFLSAATRTLLPASAAREFDRAARWPESPQSMRRGALERSRELFAPELGSRRYPARTERYLRSKAIEDTLLFRDGRLLALNELGHDPHAARRTLGAVARRELLGARRSPRSLNATSTHDTKRSEDVRARLLALTVRASEFSALVEAIEKARDWPVNLGPRELWYSLQTVLAAWPEQGVLLAQFAARISQHLEKAAREAKVRSSWIAPDRGYESEWSDATLHLIHATTTQWRRKFDALRIVIAKEGERLALTQLAWKCFLPGVPDFYQGCERSRLLLTDPDNRDPVDFAKLGGDHSSKLRATRSWLALRARRADALRRATVEPVQVHGRGSAAAIAFLRGPVLVVAHAAGEVPKGAHVVLPSGEFHDALAERTLEGARSIAVQDAIGPRGVGVFEHVRRSRRSRNDVTRDPRGARRGSRIDR